MSKLDRIKAEISFHEKMFFAALAVLLSIIGWSVSHYEKISSYILMAALIGLFLSLGYGLWNYKKIKKLLMELEDA